MNQAEIKEATDKIGKALTDYFEGAYERMEKIPMNEAGYKVLIDAVKNVLPLNPAYIIEVGEQTAEDRRLGKSAPIRIKFLHEFVQIDVTVER